MNITKNSQNVNALQLDGIEGAPSHTKNETGRAGCREAKWPYISQETAAAATGRPARVIRATGLSIGRKNQRYAWWRVIRVRKILIEIEFARRRVVVGAGV